MSQAEEEQEKDGFVNGPRKVILQEAMSKEAWASHKENHLVLAGASFAAIVALTCLSELKGWQRVALFCFSIALPVNVDSYIKSRRSLLHYMKSYLNFRIHIPRVFIGTFAVYLGITALIAHQSPTAACLFATFAAYIVFYQRLHRLLGWREPRLDEMLKSHIHEGSMAQDSPPTASAS